MIFDRMQASVDSMMKKIYDLPFNCELAQGSLSKQTFIFYIQQDALYLAEFSRALAITAARLSDNEFTKNFLQFALDAIRVERELHENYMRQFDVKIETHPTPTCFTYTNYLLKTATIASVEEAVASLLPCFWVYREVGQHITRLSKNHENNPYREWINLYSSEAFNASVESAVSMTNRLAEETSFAIQENMVAAFIYSTKLEWKFWDSAYQLEKWFP